MTLGSVGRGQVCVGVVEIHTLVVEEFYGLARSPPWLLKSANCCIPHSPRNSSTQEPLMASYCPESNMKPLARHSMDRTLAFILLWAQAPMSFPWVLPHPPSPTYLPLYLGFQGAWCAHPLTVTELISFFKTHLFQETHHSHLPQAPEMNPSSEPL